MKEKVFSIGKLILGFIGILLITSITVGVGLQVSDSISIPFVLEASQFVGFILGSLLVIRLFNLPLYFHKPTKSEMKLGAGVLIISLLLSISVTLLFSVFNLTPPQNTISETLREGSTLVVLGFIALNFLFVGPAEELVFRGYIQEQFRESMSARVSIGGSSFLFSIVHIPAMMSGEVLAMVSYLVVLLCIGGLLGYTYERTHNIFLPIVIHACYNSVSAIPFLFG